jgi:hypothetical protein
MLLESRNLTAMRGAGQHAGIADTSVSGTWIVELHSRKECQQNSRRTDSPEKRYFRTVHRSALFCEVVIRFSKLWREWNANRLLPLQAGSSDSSSLCDATVQPAATRLVAAGFLSGPPQASGGQPKGTASVECLPSKGRAIQINEIQRICS